MKHQSLQIYSSTNDVSADEFLTVLIISQNIMHFTNTFLVSGPSSVFISYLLVFSCLDDSISRHYYYCRVCAADVLLNVLCVFLAIIQCITAKCLVAGLRQV